MEATKDNRNTPPFPVWMADKFRDSNFRSSVYQNVAAVAFVVAAGDLIALQHAHETGAVREAENWESAGVNALVTSYGSLVLGALDLRLSRLNRALYHAK